MFFPVPGRAIVLLMKYRYTSIYYVIVDPIKNMGNVREYLIANTKRFVTFHFFAGYDPRQSYLCIYTEGKKVLQKPLPSYTGRNHVLKLLSNYLLYVFILFRYVRPDTSVLVANPIFCIGHRFFSIFKKLRFVFWIGDYYPDAAGFMKFYNALVLQYNRTLPYVLYESPPIEKIYHQLAPKELYRKLVTLGIRSQLSPKRVRKDRENVLGFIGVIRKQQGLDLMFQYLKVSHNTRLEVIGDGYWLVYYKRLAASLGITHKVKFFGFVEDKKPIIANWDFGMALYENKTNNVSKYCEPTKIKDYLEYNLPVVTTRTTYFYTELEAFGAGVAVDETSQSIARAVRKIILNRSSFAAGVGKLVKKYEYSTWYAKHFSFLEKP